MSSSLDRAYATLGLAPGVSGATVKRRYRHLVRRWHPDQYAGDPALRDEASTRIRAIIDAYKLIQVSSSTALPREPREAGAPPPRPPSGDGSTRLSREEVEALIQSIGRPGFVGTALDALGWLLPLGAAFLLALPSRGSSLGRPQRWLISPAVDKVLAVCFLALAGIQWYRARRS